jgi:hypothetical protein
LVVVIEVGTLGRVLLYDGDGGRCDKSAGDEEVASVVSEAILDGGVEEKGLRERRFLLTRRFLLLMSCTEEKDGGGSLVIQPM